MLAAAPVSCRANSPYVCGENWDSCRAKLQQVPMTTLTATCIMRDDSIHVVGLAATFSCAPAARWLTLWLRHCGIHVEIVQADYGSLLRELSAPSALGASVQRRLA